MLLLVTIGLVLVAAVTLVIGFVSNSLPPIYVSIVCSFLAAVVLFVFSRMNRRRAATAPGGGAAPAPAPAPRPVPPAPSAFGASESPVPRRGPKVVTGAGSAPPQFADTDGGSDAEPTRQFRPVPAARRTSAPTGEPAAAEPQPAAAVVVEPVLASLASRPGPTSVPAAAPPGATPGVPAAPGADVDGHDEGADDSEALEDGETPFPIEDYDGLRVAEILPLLPELDEVELEEVLAHEEAGAARSTILHRIDALLAAIPVADEPKAQKLEAVAEQEDTGEVDEDEEEEYEVDLPIADYDSLGVTTILPLLAELDAAELEEVRDYEDAGRGRVTILFRIDALLDSADAAEEPEDEPAAVVPDQRVAFEADLEPVPAAGEPVDEGPGAALPLGGYDALRVAQILPRLGELNVGELEQVRDYEEATRNRVTILTRINLLIERSAAEEPAPGPAEVVGAHEDHVDAGGVFPIVDYDVLRVSEILPLLAGLDAAELEQVRDYEQANRVRVTVLNRVGVLLDSALAAADEEQVQAVDTDYEEDVLADPSALAADFPIADYDELRVAEILPMLSQLTAEELEEVAAHEQAAAGRTTILTRIDRLLRA